MESGNVIITSKTEEAPYRINHSDIKAGTLCECGHSIAAHGSNGIICAACRGCKQFVERENATSRED